MVLLAMIKQFIITIKALPAKPALWMSFEAGSLIRILISLSRIPILNVPPELIGGHQIVLVNKDLLVPDTEVAMVMICRLPCQQVSSWKRT